MSFQKKRPIRDRLRKKPFTLSKGARGCNPPSTETRAEKLARKRALSVAFHKTNSQNLDRITAILAGTHYRKDGRKVDSFNSLPHIGEKEQARHARRLAR